MIILVVFYSSIANSHLCNTYLNFLLNFFWAIHQEFFFLSILKKLTKLQKEKRGGVFLEKLLAYSIRICLSGTPQ